MAEMIPKIRIVSTHIFISHFCEPQIGIPDERRRTWSVCRYLPDSRRVAYNRKHTPVDVNEEVRSSFIRFYCTIKGIGWLGRFGWFLVPKSSFVDIGEGLHHCSMSALVRRVSGARISVYPRSSSNHITIYTFTDTAVPFLFLLSVPHPSENHIQVRIQMYGTSSLPSLPSPPHPAPNQHLSIDKLSSLTALLTALSDLDSLCETVENAYDTSLRKDKYEKWEEKSWLWWWGRSLSMLEGRADIR
jgi:hypothetical protein